MIETPHHSPSTIGLALSGLAVAALLPHAGAATLAALAAAVAIVRTDASASRQMRWWRTSLVVSTVALLAAAWLAEIDDRRYAGRAVEELEASHRALWHELEEYAETAVSSLSDAASPPADQRERFARLRAVAAADVDRRLHLLLWDRDGDLHGWWGPGLLPDLEPAARGDGERGVAQSALAATLHVARTFRDSGGRRWTLIAAESFPHDGPPPVAHADRERWQSVGWSLAPTAGAEGWRLSATSGVPGRSAAPRWRRWAVAVVGLLGLLWTGERVLSVRGSGGTAAGSRPKEALISGLGAGAGAALLATGAGASATSAAALGTAVVALAVVGRDGGRDRSRIVRLAAFALGAAAGPALLLVAARAPGASTLVADLSLLSGTTAAWRTALSIGVLAVWSVAARGLGATVGQASERAPLGIVDAWPFAAAAAGALLVDRPWPAAVAFAATGVGVAARWAGSRQRTIGVRLGALLLASVVAGGAWSAGARQGERIAVLAELSSFLPPAPESMASFADLVERSFAAVDPSARLPDGGSNSVPEDLAYALWRDSPLSREDLLAAVEVTGPSGERALYSSGLPIDTGGGLDLSPTRWIDLAPEPWVARRIGGETASRDAHGRPWLVRWLAVPLPGFETGSGLASRQAAGAPASGDRSSGAGGTPRRVVLYDARGRVTSSPWPEGTPRPSVDRWLDRPLSDLVATPEGPAFAAARSSASVTAVAFLPRARAWWALERVGGFVAGAWVWGCALALLGGLVLVQWSAVTGEARLLWRSYSGRLVLVFTLLLIAPLAVGSTWVAHTYAKRLERQKEVAALDSLHSAQRVLGEYVLSLEPGFGVGTAVDDRLLEWLARVVRSEVHLYWGSELYASSKRDLFDAGVLSRRLPGEIWERVYLSGERVVRRVLPGSAGEAEEIYAPLEIPGLPAEATKLVLALPSVAQQGELAAEIDAIRRRAFLAAAALAVVLAVSGALLARRFARPIEEIVRGTQRIADGAATLGYSPDELELEALAAAIDRMAARVSEARERLLVEKSLVERIAENVTAAVVGLDAAGRVVFANRMAREMLHATPGENLGDRLREAGSESLLEAFRASTRAEPAAARVDRGDDERDWTLVRVPLPGPGDPAELVVVEDVTDVARAQRLDAWAAMARIIAHEIKNPLTPIRLSAEHLREAWERDREHFEAVFDRCTDNILRQVEELRRTASEFSLYSEIPRIERRPDDLREAIGEVVEAYQIAPPVGVEIAFESGREELPAVFDRRLLGRAVRNLIENAVRASAGAGRVEVGVEERGDELAVRVADRGPGVPEALLSRVVEPHFSTQSGGTGLGLPIASRIAEEHGGSLTLRNAPSGGLEVTITIPRR